MFGSVALKHFCADCVVRDQALCSSLTDEELAQLNRLRQRRRVGRRQTIVWAGDDNVICANLLSGVLKLVASTPDGREQVVGLLYPGDFVGQPFADQADFTLTALTQAELCVFQRRSFERLLEEHSRMAHLLLQRTLQALNGARGRMLMLARTSAEGRVAGLLLDIARRADTNATRAPPGEPLTFNLLFTRGQMADVLGLTIETVSRQMTKLRDAGVIGLPGGRVVAISDRAELASRARAC